MSADGGCCVRCSRVWLSSFISLLIACGGTLLGLGIYYYVTYNYNGTEFALAVALGMIITGSVILLICIIGCIATITNNLCCLITFSVCLILVAAGCLAVGIYAFVKLPDVDSLFQSAWESADADTRIQIMKQFNCIGELDCTNAAHDTLHTGMLVTAIVSVSVAGVSILGFIACLVLCVKGKNRD